MNRIGKRVRQLRYRRAAEGLAYSQEWLAAESGVSRATIINLEGGSYMNTRTRKWVVYHPSDDILRRLADALGVSFPDLEDLP